MKKILILFLLIPFGVSAQVFVNTGTMSSSGTVMMPEKYVDFLKGTKTYFIVPEYMSDQTGPLTEAISKVWTFNDIQAITLNEADKITAPKSAFFNISGYIYEDLMFILMQLTVNIPKGHPVIKNSGDQIFAGFYLATDVGNYPELLKIYRKHGSKETLTRFTSRDMANADYTNFYYSQAKYYNMQLGQICNYLAIINDALMDPAQRPRGTWGLMKVSDNNEIKNLKTTTLYVPDYLLKTKRMVMGGITTTETTKAELMADYKYSYEMLPQQEISDRILNSTEPVYYVDFISTNATSFFVIFNSVTHKPVYAKLISTTIPSSKNFRDVCAKIDGEEKSGPPSPFKK